jgi:hypothetical protein
MLTNLNNSWYRSGKTSNGNPRFLEDSCLPLKFLYINRPKANKIMKS